MSSFELGRDMVMFGNDSWVWMWTGGGDQSRGRETWQGVTGEG